MTEIRIKIANTEIRAELFDTTTGKLIAEILPIKAKFNTWGDEIYFSIPLKAPLDETQAEEVKLGDLGYWPDGSAFCIFFGKTPISSGDKIIPASKVNIVGRVLDDPSVFKGLKSEKEISIYKA